MNKERLLKYALYLAGIIALAAFVVTRDEELLDDVTEDSYRHGDLYRMALVKDFKLDIPDRCTPEESDVVWQDQRVIFIGDSFAETCRGHKPLPEMIADALDEPVFHVSGNEAPEYFNPILLFKEKKINVDKKRLVIVERVERSIRTTYEKELERNPALTGLDETFGEKLEHIGSNWFSTHDEELYQFLLHSSDMSRPVVELWNTAMFHLMNKISAETPVYSLNPPFLFYFDETDPSESSSYYSPHPDRSLKRLRRTSKKLGKSLRNIIMPS